MPGREVPSPQTQGLGHHLAASPERASGANQINRIVTMSDDEKPKGKPKGKGYRNVPGMRGRRKGGKTDATPDGFDRSSPDLTAHTLRACANWPEDASANP